MKRKELGIIARLEDDPEPFGKQTFFFFDMIKEGMDLPIDVYIFSPADWEKSENKYETRVFYMENSVWKSKIHKIPQIVYDRYTVKSQPEFAQIANLREFLKSNNFNFLTNFELVELLKNKVRFHDFLINQGLPTIEGVLINNLDKNVLFNYMKSSGFVYIKPLNGSRGQGISVIEQINEIEYCHHIEDKKKSVSKNELLLYIKNEFNNDLFFVQPRANTFTIENSPFDIRVLIQNKGNNNYILTGMAIRKGKTNSWVSNLDAGGKGIRLEEIETDLEKQLGVSSKEIEKNISEISFKCCNELHRQFGDFSEIAFDFLLTKDLGPVIIEGNSKPARWIFNSIAFSLPENSELHKKYSELRKQSVKAPLIFSINNNFKN